MASVVPFVTSRARRMADPVHEGSDRHIFYVRVKDIPPGIPDDPNPRIPNINRAVYREVERSLLGEEGEPGYFHMKNKGITLIAKEVVRGSADNEYSVVFDRGDGMVDGRHTYEILQKHRADELLPEDQFVKIEILTRVPSALVYEIAGGLNTGMQVQPMSLDNLQGQFDWIKGVIAGEPYAKAIAWKENERGDLDGRDVVSILTLFNIGLFPNRGTDYPITAYSRKAAALDLYEKNPESYQKLRPILKDIFRLHDEIRSTARDRWNESAGGRAGAFKFVEEARRGEFWFPFTETKSKWRLLTSALYPILGAFRWTVEDTGEGYQWRNGFENVRSLWEVTAPELMRIAKDSYQELGRSPTQMGKSRNLWQALYSHVGMIEMQSWGAGVPAVRGEAGSPRSSAAAGQVPPQSAPAVDERYLPLTAEFSHRRPVEVRINGAAYPVRYWYEVLVSACRTALDANPTAFAAAVKSGLPSRPGGEKFLSADAHDLPRNPKQVDEGIWVETGFNTKDTCERVKRVLHACGIDSNSVGIRVA
ncbi:MAG TPA: AIPR family protein [Chloroflexota bacterium]|nr:AIPR family protein [Chloroflexota bacterium]